MDRFTADVSLGGDRNHVVVRSDLTVAEIMVLQAIHGPQGVANIAKQPNAGTTQTRDSHETIKTYLDKMYGRTRVGPDSDKRPALVRVFPGWPGVNLPTTLKEARIAPQLIKGGEVPDDDEDDDEPKPVHQNTYWHDADSGEIGMTEKGDFLPENVSKITKANYEKLKKAGDDSNLTE